MFAFTRPVDHTQKSQIREREKRSIRRRLREVKDQVELVKKRKQTTGDVSYDRTQDKEFGNEDIEADDEHMEQIYDNQSSNEVEQNGDRQVNKLKLVTSILVMKRFRVVMEKF